MKLTVDTRRLVTELCQLAMFSEPAETPAEGVAVTRVVFTPTDRQARLFVEALAQDAGLTIRRDAIGNTFFRWEGSSSALPAIATGSHIDAIPNAGMYDGTVGVLGGIAAVRALRTAGFRPKRPIDIILFTSEEPTRFGIGCLGSRLLSGVLTADAARRLRDHDGLLLDEVRASAGFTGDLETVPLSTDFYSSFVELHIEQGPILEQEKLSIGIVTAIAAPASLRLTIKGEGGHAGAMLMPARRDALVAAAEIIQAVERSALETGSVDTVATVGMCEVFPSAVNSVPSRVKLSLDVRDIDLARRDSVLSAIEAACSRIARSREVKVVSETINMDAPASSGNGIIEAIAQAARMETLQPKYMVSRAYHDSLFMSRLCPVAMIFIPCRNGVSHRPDEYATPEDIGAGVAVLARTLAHLSLS